MKLLSRIAVLTFAAALLFAAAAVLFVHRLKQWSAEERQLAAPVVVEFPRGTSLSDFSGTLAEAQVIDSPLYFRLWVRFFADYSRLQAGTYRFEGSVSPRGIVEALRQGRIYQPIVFKFTIPEGFTYRQLAERLTEQRIGSAEEFNRLFTDAEFLKENNIQSANLEGFLYPATYPFTSMPSAREALRRAVAAFWRQLPENYAQEVEARGLTLTQAVTFASLIELETPKAAERPLISEVIWRRLKAGAPLGIDAAIIYGIRDYNGNITSAHLKDATNPYNTRMHPGLPPTPIGSPSRDSLAAVLTPASAGNYYFVVDADNPGTHLFSKSLKDHLRNVRRLVQSQRALKKVAPGRAIAAPE